MSEDKTQQEIAEACDEIKGILLEKNRKYGNAALNPVQVFSELDPVQQIRVRIDDKLRRVQTSRENEDEDPILDLIGYLVLLRIATRKQKPLYENESHS